jgi:uncharacterized protein (DUF433 family)
MDDDVARVRSRIGTPRSGTRSQATQDDGARARRTAWPGEAREPAYQDGEQDSLLDATPLAVHDRAVGGSAVTVHERIEIDPGVMLGKPVIRGTRVTVELVLRKLADGASESDLLDAYPRLTRDDIHAAMRFAADTLAHEDVVLSSPMGTDASRS